MQGLFYVLATIKCLVSYVAAAPHTL
eukprot:SAG11_NODE_32891_length_280_cov_0.662983_1_plen_25_part_10